LGIEDSNNVGYNPSINPPYFMASLAAPPSQPPTKPPPSTYNSDGAWGEVPKNEALQQAMLLLSVANMKDVDGFSMDRNVLFDPADIYDITGILVSTQRVMPLRQLKEMNLAYSNALANKELKTRSKKCLLGTAIVDVMIDKFNIEDDMNNNKRLPSKVGYHQIYTVDAMTGDIITPIQPMVLSKNVDRLKTLETKVANTDLYKNLSMVNRCLFLVKGSTTTLKNKSFDKGKQVFSLTSHVDVDIGPDAFTSIVATALPITRSLNNGKILC